MTTEKFVMFMLISVISISANAQDAGIDRISDCLVTGYWKDIEAVDDLVFATNGYGLMIYRFDPDEGIDEPVELVRYPTPGSAGGFVICDTLCYLADGSGGLKILSIADVNNIYEVGSGPPDYNPSSIKVVGDYAYITSSNGFSIISVADPSQPEVVGNLYIIRIISFEIYQDYVYLIREADETVYIISINDVRNPELITTFEMNVRPADLELKGDTLFVEGDSIRVFSLEDAENPQLITSIHRNRYTQAGIRVHETTLFLKENHLEIIDIRNIFRPINHNTLRVNPAVGVRNKSIDVQDDYCFTCGNNFGWQIIDISNYNDLEVIFDGVERGVFHGITKQDEYLFITDYLSRPPYLRSTYGLRVVSIEDNQNPVEVANVDMPSNHLEKVQIVGDYAYVYNMGFYIYDVSDPEEPELVDQLPLGTVIDMFVIDDYAYLRATDRLYIMSLSDAPNVEIIGQYPPDDRIPIKGLGLTDDFVLVTSYLPGNPYKFQIYDRSDPVELEMISEIDIPEALGRIEVYEDYVYTCGRSNPLSVISISDPEHPELVHVNEDIVRKRDFRLEGSFLYVCHEGSGFDVLSLEDPARPELVGSYDTPGSAWSICIDDGFAYVADENNIGVYDLSRVMGFWDVRLSSESYDFGEVHLNTDSTWQLTILNEAQQPVDILDISSDSAVFTVDFDDTLTIDPDEEATVEVTFTPTEKRPYRGELIIHTERRDLRVSLSGTGVDLSAPEDEFTPFEFGLKPAYPNPFNFSTSLRYTLDRDGFVMLKLYDLAGREVASLANEKQSAGNHQTVWDAEGRPSGMYLLRLNVDGRERVTKLILIR